MIEREENSHGLVVIVGRMDETPTFSLFPNTRTHTHTHIRTGSIIAYILRRESPVNEKHTHTVASYIPPNTYHVLLLLLLLLRALNERRR